MLLDPARRGLVASHHARVNGDPIAALQACLRVLAGEVGNRGVGLVATTGPVRELAGA